MPHFLCDSLTPELQVKEWIGLLIFFLVTCVPAAAYFIKHTWFEPKPPDTAKLITREEFERDIAELKASIAELTKRAHEDDKLLNQTLLAMSGRISAVDATLKTLSSRKG